VFPLRCMGVAAVLGVLSAVLLAASLRNLSEDDDFSQRVCDGPPGLASSRCHESSAQGTPRTRFRSVAPITETPFVRAIHMLRSAYSQKQLDLWTRFHEQLATEARAAREVIPRGCA
jgi:hypothetical protein